MKKKKKMWVCWRQRSGRLVKVCKALPPRRSRWDSPEVRAEKNKILKNPLRSPLRRTPADRVELMLALMGDRSTCYTLTYFDNFLPGSYQEARGQLSAFLRRLRRYKKEKFFYVYAIEGRHGDHRYHLHITLRDEDFDQATVEYLWGYGENVVATPLIRGENDSYYRMARYYTKERADGVKFPLDAKTWGCAREMYKALPMLERWQASSGKVWVPKEGIVLHDTMVKNRFGQFRYVVYLTRGEK